MTLVFAAISRPSGQRNASPVCEYLLDSSKVHRRCYDCYTFYGDAIGRSRREGRCTLFRQSVVGCSSQLFRVFRRAIREEMKLTEGGLRSKVAREAGLMGSQGRDRWCKRRGAISRTRFPLSSPAGLDSPPLSPCSFSSMLSNGVR